MQLARILRTLCCYALVDLMRCQELPIQSISAEALSSSLASIQYLHVTSNIQSRFATTFVSSKIANAANISQEITFSVSLPISAFITNFTMHIDGKTISALIKEKAKARKEFETAKARGESTALVAKNNAQMQISVNVAAQSKAIFNLTYQEVLQRSQGVYKHVLNLNSQGQLIEDLTVDIYLSERTEISQLKVPKIEPKIGDKTTKELMTLEDASDVAIKSTITAKRSNVHVSYKPSLETQKTNLKDNNGTVQLVMLYDVKRDDSAGELEVVNGYFVHFFAPTDNLPGQKAVVFVLDRSGSMNGEKFEQMKQAMKTILNQLRPSDTFNIVTFATGAALWRPESVSAEPKSVKAAQDYIDDLTADGGTNIYEGLKKGFEALKQENTSATSSFAQMIVFLTDGEATMGNTSAESILGAVSDWKGKLGSGNSVSLHSISFGDDADYQLLRSLSARNNGIARKIYADSDAAVQLQGFYEEIASPLLKDIQIKYLNESVDSNSLVQNADISTLYDGSELMILGKLRDVDDQQIVRRKYHHRQLDPSALTKFAAEINGVGYDGPKTFAVEKKLHCWNRCPTQLNSSEEETSSSLPATRRNADECRVPCSLGETTREVNTVPLPAESVGGFVERMYAYLTIKRLIDQAKYSETNPFVQAKLNKKALKLSLKYHFVTDLTSLVIVKPDGQNETVEQETSEETYELPVAVRSFGHQVLAAAYSNAVRYRPSLNSRRHKASHKEHRATTRSGNANTLPATPVITSPIISILSTLLSTPLTPNLFPVTKLQPIFDGLSSPLPTAESGMMPSAKAEQQHSSNPGLKPADDFREGCFKTWPANYFSFEKNYLNKTASVSRMDCADFCFENRFCRVALFQPRTGDCLLSYQYQLPVCSSVNEKLPETMPVLIYCVNCQSVVRKNKSMGLMFDQDIEGGN